MAIIAHRQSFRKGLRIWDRTTRTRGRIAAVTANGVTVWLDNGKTLYLDISAATMRIATDLSDTVR